MGEFELIGRYFQRPMAAWPQAPGVLLGIGDDCALLAPRPGHVLAVSSDMLVEGRHFLPDVDPAALGHKTLAVNLSDLAAMGAEPLGFTLALALPDADDRWLSGFSHGLLALAQSCACPLVGGDTTRGPRNLCVTVLGQVPTGQALRRDAARPGDDIYVSGTLGDARLALAALLGDWPELQALPAEAVAAARTRLERPEPRLALGQALRGVAHACADVSDGLLGDLRHIAQASQVTAEVLVDALLASPAVSAAVRALPTAGQWTCVLAGGDDYELVFTAPPAHRAAVVAAARVTHTPVTRIGRIQPALSGAHATSADPARVRLVSAGGEPLSPPAGAQLGSFDHFA